MNLRFLCRLLPVLALFITADIASAQGAKGKPAPITAKEVAIHPWTANRREMKIDPKMKGIFDEHRVTVTAGKQQTRIRIKGEMKNAGGNVDGSPVLHLGKIAMVPYSPRSGTIKVGVSSAEDNARYLIVMEVGEEKLKTEFIDLKEKMDYNWSISGDGSQITYSVFQGGEKKWSLTAPESEIKAFGIGTFTRFEGQKTEVDFTID
ncbi:hypothetical protein OKA04_12150 [Luteolibacter flavescens]|uniref:Uncharacterized protein n=1 Tax=Luteolibacter flavescens TaxID=1859460 RepID=A0ABT3FPJ9_9BACT|nr:hypothetical protein [Luteolibacter flavescens]MCW1885482.1 hypothetical protein [Luteolibacter flavescens]